MQSDFNALDNMTPAQSDLLARLQATEAPVTVLGDRRYTLDGDRLHHAVVGALLRRGVLEDNGDTLVLASEYRPNISTDIPLEDDSDPVKDEPSDLAPVAEHDPLTALATRHAELRRADDVGATDGGAKARARLIAQRHHVSRDESVFARLWRRLETVLTHSVVVVGVAALLASCAPASGSARASGSNDYPLTAEACWGAGGGGGTAGFWLYNWGAGEVVVRNDLSVIVYPDGSERQAISEMDLRRYRETQTFQQTVRIGPKQQGMFGMVSADAIRFDERVDGWVYSSPPGSHLVLVADTPNGRVNFDTRRGC